MLVKVDSVSVKEVLKTYHRSTPFKGTHLMEAEPHENPPAVSPFDTISAETQTTRKINDSLVNKNGNYTNNVFELKKDPGEYQPTTFETLKTEQFLKDTLPPSQNVIDAIGMRIPNLDNIEGQLESIYRKICLAEVPRGVPKPDPEISCGLEDDPIPHVLHGSELVASKNIWEKPRNSPHFLDLVKAHNYLMGKRFHRGISKFSDIRVPLWRKLVICLYRGENDKTAELLHAATAVGYLSTPQIYYGKRSTASVSTHDKSLPVNSIFSQDILYSFSKTAVSLITCGFEHCTVLTSSGTVASWGYGGSGCLGHGNYVSYTSPKLVKGLPDTISYIESGAYHTAAITGTGEVYVWGRSDVGQLGVSLKSLQKDSMGWVALTPLEVEFFKGEARRVALGEAHTLVLNDKGEIYSAGWDQHGQSGQDKADERAEPATYFSMIRGIEGVVAIGAGSLFSAAIDSDGRVYTWGNNDYGQLGLGQTGDMREPKIVDLGEERALEVCCGEANALVYCRSGAIFGWGQGFCDDDKTKEIFRMTPEYIHRLDSVHYYGIEPPSELPLMVLSSILTYFNSKVELDACCQVIPHQQSKSKRQINKEET